jgi:hypothetical protein
MFNSIQYTQYLRKFNMVLTQNIKPKFAKKTAIHHTKKRILVTACLIALTPSANAGFLPNIEVFRNMEEVSDSDLGHMRGKFASSNQVMYFGIEMVSQWLTPTGDLVTAGANLNIDFRANESTPIVQYVPTATIVYQNHGTSTQNMGTNSVSGGAGLANVSGVSQSIQVSGQSNSIKNGIDMNVDLTSATNAGGVISSAVQGQLGSVTAIGNDGVLATVTLSKNTIGVGIIVPGQGQVEQQLRDQGMFQSARIGGDLNNIHNNITMSIGLNNDQGISSGNAHAALEGLRALPLNGMF